MRRAALLTLSLSLVTARADPGPAPVVAHTARDNVIFPGDAVQPVEHSPDFAPVVEPDAAAAAAPKDAAEYDADAGEGAWEEGVLTRVRKSCPPYGDCKQFCIEVRPRDPRQSPFIICEPPHIPDLPKPPVPPYYPYGPPYPYPPEYEYPPYPPPPEKEPVPPYPPYPPYYKPPYKEYPYPPYYKPPYKEYKEYPNPQYYKKPYYWPYPGPYSSNAASSAAASATATTALHGMGGGVPHLRDATEDQQAAADFPETSRQTYGSGDSAASTATATTADVRAAYGVPYRPYPYPPLEWPFTMCCHEYKYPLPLPVPVPVPPKAAQPVALLQLFMRPSHHHHHYPLLPEYREAEVRAAESSQPMKVDLNVDHGKKELPPAARAAQMWSSFGAPFGQPDMMYAPPGMMYGYPGMGYGGAEYPSNYFKAAETPAPLPVKPDVIATPGSISATADFHKGGIAAAEGAAVKALPPKASSSSIPGTASSSPASIQRDAAAPQPSDIAPAAKTSPPAPSAAKPKEAEEAAAPEARMPFELQRGFPQQYGWQGYGYGGGGGPYPYYPGMMPHGMH